MEGRADEHTKKAYAELPVHPTRQAEPTEPTTAAAAAAAAAAVRGGRERDHTEAGGDEEQRCTLDAADAAPQEDVGEGGGPQRTGGVEHGEEARAYLREAAH